MRKWKKAVALKYEKGSVPRVRAKGRGRLAERIVREALSAGVPVHHDALLADALYELQLDAEIPPELYRAVAAVLAFVLSLERGGAGPPKRGTPRGVPINGETR